MPQPLRLVLPLALAVVTLSPRPAAADEAAAKKADALNDAGKELYKQGDLAGAAGKIREAIAVDPQGRFYFNLCVILDKTGDLDGALEACDEVYRHDTSDDVKAMTGQRAADIRAKKRKRDAATPKTPAAPAAPPADRPQASRPPAPSQAAPPTAGPTRPVGQPQAQPTPAYPQPYYQGVEQTAPASDYKWALGFNVTGVGNQGIGRDFARQGGGAGFHVDLLLSPYSNLGARGYVNVINFAEEPGRYEFRTGELGAAVYWHRPIGSNLLITPILGAHVAALTVAGYDSYGLPTSMAFQTFGFRAELAFQWLLGGGRHVLFAAPTASFYLPATTDVAGDTSPAELGLDNGGAVVGLALGYEYRFASLSLGSVVLQ